MLHDEKAEALATNFGAHWLYLHDMHAKTPSPRLFPDFDASLREAFERETTLFLDSVFRDDRSVLDLVRANDTFMNERLARHYGVANVAGNDFRRVEHPAGSPRRGLGLLGHSSILTITSLGPSRPYIPAGIVSVTSFSACTPLAYVLETP
jgi:hypothetical protein